MGDYTTPESRQNTLHVKENNRQKVQSYTWHRQLPSPIREDNTGTTLDPQWRPRH